MRPRAFTLIELLVVVSVIALLVGLLVPALAGARNAARTTACLSNVRNMQIAHWMYMEDHQGAFVDAGLPHGGLEAYEQGSWISTLADYYESHLARRCPADHSPHWPAEDGDAGVPIEGTESRFRRSSYGVNNYLTSFAPADHDPSEPRSILHYTNLNQVPEPGNLAHFLEMAELGSFAGSDHPHIENWHIPGLPGAAPAISSQHLETNQHGGEPRSAQAAANYGFLDGHARTLRFEEVYTDLDRNLLDPALQRR